MAYFISARSALRSVFAASGFFASSKRSMCFAFDLIGWVIAEGVPALSVLLAQAAQ